MCCNDLQIFLEIFKITLDIVCARWYHMFCQQGNNEPADSPASHSTLIIGYMFSVYQLLPIAMDTHTVRHSRRHKPILSRYGGSAAKTHSTENKHENIKSYWQTNLCVLRWNQPKGNGNRERRGTCIKPQRINPGIHISEKINIINAINQTLKGCHMATPKEFRNTTIWDV